MFQPIVMNRINPAHDVCEQTWPEFKRGIKDTLPILFGLLPFGLILGAQAAQKGMSVLETVMMMGFNFAGGSEFAVVGLWSNPLPVLLILTTTFMINSRHILMGAALSPYIAHLPKRKLLPTLFFMVDESWAVAIAEAKRHSQAGLPPFSLPHYFGVCLSLYVVWIGCGFLGSHFGKHLGDVEQYGFAMAFPAVFLVLLKGMWRGFQAALPWLVSLITAALIYLCYPTGGWYVIGGTLAGLLYAYCSDDPAGARPK